VNVELYDSGEMNEEDCLGWITIMEKCESNLREKLKKDELDLKKTKKDCERNTKIGIKHKDRKLANYLLIGDVVKICDFGLVWESSGRKSYRNLGYTRKGKKYRYEYALCKFLSSNNLNTFILVAGTPGFAEQWQLGGGGSHKDNDFLYLFCDWNTSWSLIYRSIDEKQRTEIDKIVKVPKNKYFIMHFHFRIAACEI